MSLTHQNDTLYEEYTIHKQGIAEYVVPLQVI